MKMQDVAKYMLEELEKNGVLYQEGLVHTIKEKFGEQFIFSNSYGTLSLDRVVIREFNKLKSEDVIWDKKEHCWRETHIN